MRNNHYLNQKQENSAFNNNKPNKNEKENQYEKIKNSDIIINNFINQNQTNIQYNKIDKSTEKNSSIDTTKKKKGILN
jgi:hypothetical protein